MTRYIEYKKQLIERHVCRNGRFLQDILLDENNNPVFIDGKVVGGGDNQFLYGGILLYAMAKDKRTPKVYMHRLVDGLGTLTTFCRRKNHWAPKKELSKDELCGAILGISTYLACFADPKAKNTLSWLATELENNRYKSAGSWVFRFPFASIFKKLGLPATYSWLDQKIFNLSMRFLPFAYKAARFLGIKKNFFNVALFCHCMLMLFETGEHKKSLSAFNKLYSSFITDKDGKGNLYLKFIWGLVNFGKVQVNDIATLEDFGWPDDLPRCKVGGPEVESKGECFTWEHPNDGGHKLRYDWAKVSGRLGPVWNGGCWVESCGLGYVLLRALAGAEGEMDGGIPFLDTDGAICGKQERLG